MAKAGLSKTKMRTRKIQKRVLRRTTMPSFSMKHSTTSSWLR